MVLRSVLLIGLLLVACTPAASLRPSPGDSEREPARPSCPASPTGSPVAGSLAFDRAEVVASNLEVPWGIAFQPDGTAVVAERETGRLLAVQPGEAPRDVTRIDDLPATGEGGLLGVAVDPGIPDVLYVFVNTGAASRILRLAPGAAPTVVVDDIPATSFHTGGHLAFGPDGMLYASVGDAQQGELAQDPASLAGKILRVEPDGGVPGDNPVAGSPVWALGFRNVEGFTWDGDGRMWATEFGESTADELNLVEPGANYGWPLHEGGAADPPYRDPVRTWTPADASPAGIAFTDDTLWIGALRGERLWRVPLSADGQPGTPEALLVGTYGRLRSAAVAPDGSLWLTTSNRDGRGEAGPDDDLVIRVPSIGPAGVR